MIKLINFYQVTTQESCFVVVVKVMVVDLVDPRNLTLKFDQNKVSDRLNIVVLLLVFVFLVPTFKKRAKFMGFILQEYGLKSSNCPPTKPNPTKLRCIWLHIHPRMHCYFN